MAADLVTDEPRGAPALETRLHKLDEKLNALLQEIQGAQEKNNRQGEGVLSMLQSVLAKQQNYFAALEQLSQQKQVDYTILDRRLKELSEVADLVARLDAVTQENKYYKRALHSYEVESVQLHDAVLQKDAELKRMRTEFETRISIEVAQKQQMREWLNETQLQLQRTQDDFNEQEKALRQLQEQLQSSPQSSRSRREECDGCVNCSNWERQCGDLQATLSDLRRQLEEKNEDEERHQQASRMLMKRLESQEGAHTETLEAEGASVNCCPVPSTQSSEVEELRARLQDDDGKLEAAVGKISQLEGRLAELQEVCQALQTDKDKLDRDRESLVDEVRTLREQRNVLQQEVSTLHQDSQGAVRQLEEVKEQLGSLEASCQLEKKEAEGKVLQLTAYVATLEQKVVDLESQVVAAAQKDEAPVPPDTPGPSRDKGIGPGVGLEGSNGSLGEAAESPATICGEEEERPASSPARDIALGREVMASGTAEPENMQGVDRAQKAPDMDNTRDLRLELSEVRARHDAAVGELQAACGALSAVVAMLSAAAEHDLLLDVDVSQLLESVGLTASHLGLYQPMSLRDGLMYLVGQATWRYPDPHMAGQEAERVLRESLQVSHLLQTCLDHVHALKQDLGAPCGCPTESTMKEALQFMDLAYQSDDLPPSSLPASRSFHHTPSGRSSHAENLLGLDSNTDLSSAPLNGVHIPSGEGFWAPSGVLKDLGPGDHKVQPEDPGAITDAWWDRPTTTSTIMDIPEFLLPLSSTRS